MEELFRPGLARKRKWVGEVSEALAFRKVNVEVKILKQKACYTYTWRKKVDAANSANSSRVMAYGRLLRTSQHER